MERHDVNMGGRPQIFTAEMRASFLEELAMGRSNRAACQMVGIAPQTLHLHLARDPDFRDAYTTAKAIAVDALLDEAGELAEAAVHAETGLEVARIRLRIRFLWWQAARIAPRRWGKQASAVVVSTDDADRETAKRAAFLAALAAQ